MNDVIRIDFADGGHLWIAAGTPQAAVELYDDPELTRMYHAGELTFVEMRTADVPAGADIFRGK